MEPYNVRGKKKFDYKIALGKSGNLENGRWLRTVFLLLVILVPMQFFNEFRLNQYKKKTENVLGVTNETFEKVHSEEVSALREEHEAKITMMQSKLEKRKKKLISNAQKELRPELARLENKLNKMKSFTSQNRRFYCSIHSRLQSIGIDSDTMINQTLIKINNNLVKENINLQWNLGWIYLGIYEGGKWSDRFFEIRKPPISLIGLKVEYTGSSKINLRSSPPTDNSNAGEIIGKVKKSDEIYILMIKKSGELRGVWAKVEHIVQNSEQPATICE